MRSYESVVIFYPHIEESNRDDIINRLTNILADDFNVDYWGDRKFAYEIEKHNHGHYYLISFKADNDSLREFDRIAKIQEDILRFMTVNIDN